MTFFEEPLGLQFFHFPLGPNVRGLLRSGCRRLREYSLGTPEKSENDDHRKTSQTGQEIQVD